MAAKPFVDPTAADKGVTEAFVDQTRLRVANKMAKIDRKECQIEREALES